MKSTPKAKDLVMNKLSTTRLIDGIPVYYHAQESSLPSHLEKKTKQEFAALVEEAQMNPKKAYKSALAWEKDYAFPQLDNLLAYLHLQNKKPKKAEGLIKSSYQKHPDYFFAKINYADQCVRKNKLKEIPLIFPTFNLKELFPEKSAFHVSEFRGFMVFLSNYHLKSRNRFEAKHFYELASLADPIHPSVILLEKKLFKKNPLILLANKILKLARIR
jgi:hypothetical protein